MADIMNYAVTANGTVSATVPRYNIVADIKNQKTGVVHQSLTTTFPAILGSLTAAEQDVFVRRFIDDIVRYKASQFP